MSTVDVEADRRAAIRITAHVRELLASSPDLLKRPDYAYPVADMIKEERDAVMLGHAKARRSPRPRTTPEERSSR
jgi:hypothetical protein